MCVFIILFVSKGILKTKCDVFWVQKEKDLELTARIGKELLTTQGLLEARVSSLEGDLRSANDQITQLRHDLIIKTDLLQVTSHLR